MQSMDINVDAGESFGRWKLGNDTELFKYATTVNVACGYHAGDPATMRETACNARDMGLAIGAHPGYPDLLGFGRRAIPATQSDTLDYVLYQVGALQGIAASEGITLTHVKPHGSLYAEVAKNPELAIDISVHLQRMQPKLPILIAPSVSMRALLDSELPVISENAVDLEFDDQGQNVIEKIPLAKEPEVIAVQAVRMANGTVKTNSGRSIPMSVKSMCVHGDRPNAAEIARAVRLKLEDAGILVQSVFGSDG